MAIDKFELDVDDLLESFEDRQKRIGEYRKLSSGGKYRLDFDDNDSLHGIMII